MRRRLTGTILLIYPRRVRERHGPEIVALIDDLIAHEGRSRAGLVVRLAVDGLVQRITSTATVWTVVAVLLTTSFGGLAVSDFAAASALQGVRRTAHRAAAGRHEHRTPLGSRLREGLLPRGAWLVDRAGHVGLGKRPMSDADTPVGAP